MALDTKQINVAKGGVKGAIYMGKVGTPLPAGADSEINEDFKSLGYVSDKGIKDGVEFKTKSTNDLGGTAVFTYPSEEKITFEFELLQTNTDVLKLRFGDDKVTGSDSLAITASYAPPKGSHSFVIDLALSHGHERIVIADGQVTKVGDATYGSKDVIKYPFTIQALASEKLNGECAKAYIKLDTNSREVV